MSFRSAMGIASVALGMLLGCGPGATARCKSAYEHGDSRTAVEECSRAEKQTSDSDVAARLAWSLYAAHRTQDARALIARYPSDKGLWQLTRTTLDWRAGRTDGAAAALERAAALCRLEGDTFCSSRAFLELSAFHYTRGEYRETLAASGRAAAEPAAAREPDLRARALLRVFDVLYDLGDADGAERALSAADALHAWDDSMLPFVRIKHALLFSMRGRSALAWQANLDAAEEGKRTGATAVAWSARLNLAKAAAREERADAAAEQLREAEALLPLLGQSGNSSVSLRFHRALVLHARRQWDAALLEISDALAYKPSNDWTWELQMERALIARDAGRVELAREACLAAIESVEHMRAELGADELKAWLLPTRRRPFEVLFEIEAEAGDTAAALETAERTYARTFLDAFVAARSGADGVDPAVSAFARAEALREVLPALRASPAVAPAPMAAVLTGIGRARVLLYFAGERSVWAMKVSDGRTALVRLDADATEIQRLADRIASSPADERAAETLGRLLIPEAIMPPTGDLSIVATGALAGIPFAALRVHGHRLIETWTLRFVPSLRTLAALRSANDDRSVGATVVGDPNGDLPGARAESIAVARALRVEPLLGAFASPDAVRQAAAARVLHVATHGGIGLYGAWLGLSGGEVTATDVIRWKIRPRLVVLASCASTATRAREMWGSMAASFLVAGSRAVVASLWSVDDAVTRTLVERFYREGGADRPARALARAQRWMARKGVPPSNWAAFVVLGDAT